MEPYNATPEESNAASVALTRRSIEIIQRSQDGSHPLFDAIWNNLGFHVVVVKMQSAGANIPVGRDAQAYIALILASVEHYNAQELLESALEKEA